ncbi:PPK2 family polyphosphate kinase [Demequina sp.]|uniref:PPK2 family polyphosphate kinase n=1 Tax=Demequina sp. TaxID=2050685 RepID=UPI0025FCC066|nr:PPK2 family polyphosphate kinase [Demequina sp.]
MGKKGWHGRAADALRVGPGFDLSAFDPATTPGYHGGRKAAERLMRRRGKDLSELQERLYANGRSGGTRSVLLVLQGMDTAGKGGIVRHVIGMVDPQGVQARSFGVPSEEERAHHYLWRIERALPAGGRIGVFDRSHYEDVLVVRVHDLVPPDVWGARYEEINAWEQRRVDEGVVIVKCALMVSPGVQLDRLDQRLHRPDKYWKYNPSDIDERAHWPHYMDAYQAVFDRTSTDVAPWHVIPANHKWFARLAVTELLTRAMEGMELEWPAADFDVEHERARLAALRRDDAGGAASGAAGAAPG